jgi:Ca2+-binding RTX toxin-like protein
LRDEGKAIGECSDRIRIFNLNDNADYGVDELEFANGTKLDLTDKRIDLLGAEGIYGTYVSGTDQNDILSGNNFDNLFASGKGNDILNGGGGDDTYIFNRGDGQDTIFDGIGFNRILFGEGITAGDLCVSFESNSFVVALKEEGKTISECSDRIQIFNLNNSADCGIDVFEFADGTKLELTDRIISLLGTEGSDVINWDAGKININAGDGDDTVNTGKFDDTIIGGKGADILSGNGGDDTLYGNDDNAFDDNGAPDELYGGTGFDRYFVSRNDIVVDEDGEGNVTVNGHLLTGASRVRGSDCDFTDNDGYIYNIINENAIEVIIPDDGGTVYITGNGDIPLVQKVGYTELYKQLSIVLSETLGEDGDDGKDNGDNGNGNGDSEGGNGGNDGDGGNGDGSNGGDGGNGGDGDGGNGGLRGGSPVLIASPIVFNLDGDTSNDVIALEDSAAYFDMRGWGVANKTDWAGNADGLLVYDKNNNGMIDNIKELFGNHEYKNGFEQLRAEADSNKDGKIDNLDELFDSLKVWIDGNGDGVTQSGELKSLEELGITSINLNHTVSNGSNGGDIIAAGSYTKQDGTVGEARDYLFDVSMKDSVYRGDYEITDEIEALFPNLNGFGSFKDLHVAMAVDNGLCQFIKDNMTDLASMSANFNIFMMKWSELEAKHSELGINTNGEMRFIDMIWILARMTGSTTVSDNELVTGRYIQNYQVIENTAIYNDFKDRFLSIMNIMLNFKGVEYQDSIDRIMITDTSKFIDSVLSKPFADPTVINMMINSKHFDNFISSGVKEALLTLLPFYNTPEEAYLNGTEQDNTINGSNLSEFIVGGRGNDTLKGGGGNDTYIFNRGDGQDTITDNSGFNRIVFGEGITADDLCARLDGYDIVIALKEEGKTFEESYDKIRIVYHNYVSNYRMGELVFSDGTTLDLTGMMNLLGTEGSDTISWTATQLNINTGDGDDVVNAGNFNDILAGGRGNDSLNGGGGDDTYIFNCGDGQDTITDNSGFNRIGFGEGITADDLCAKLDGSDFVIALKEDGKSFEECSDRIRIKYHNSNVNHRMSALVFSDGTELDLTGMMNLLGTGGNDNINWSVTQLNINAGDGNDTITAGGFNDTITGGEGNDSLSGGGGNDNLIGGEGNDSLSGGDGNDNLVGGEGNDTLKGGNGDDTYIFNRGDGQDTITDGSGFNRIVFGDNITAADLYARIDGKDLIIALKEEGKNFEECSDRIRITEHSYSTNYRMGALVFSDGTTLDLSGIMNLLGTEGSETINWNAILLKVNAGDGDDTVNTGNFNDTIIGGKGNDTLNGGGGDDTYVFNRGDGQDIITDNSGFNRILFGENIAAADLYARIDVRDLVIVLKEDGKSFEECSDSIRIKEHNQNTLFRMGALVFADGTILDLTGIMNLLGTEGSEAINWSVTQLNINAGDGNDTVNAGSFNDTIAGGKGNDSLNGGGGDDTYIFNRGDGQDTIADGSGFNHILFGEGISAGDLYAKIDGMDLVFALKEDGKTFEECSDKIRIVYHSGYEANRMGALVFVDGTALDLTGIMNLLGTEASDNINWGVTKLNIDVGDGDDMINAGNFNDTIAGGKGNDTLNGGGGDDTYIFSRGDGHDTITNSGGFNRIVFGEDITATDLYARIDGYDLLIAIKEGKTFEECSDRILIKYHVNDTANSIGALVFSDGTELDLTGMMNLIGTEGNDNTSWIATQLSINVGGGDDIVNAGNFNDIIAGGEGNDRLNGGGGNDIYIFNRGDGQDTITDNSGLNRIVFGEGIDADDIYAGMEGDDLILILKKEGMNFTECPDRIRVRNYKNNQLWAFELFGGVKFDLIDLTIFGTEMDDTINQSGMKTNITIAAGGGNDLLSGGEGNDILDGGNGDDTYLFYRGYGKDTIIDSNGTDTIDFGYDISISDLMFLLEGNDLIIGLKEEGKSFAALSDKLTIKNYTSSSVIESVWMMDEYNDYRNLFLNQIIAKCPTISGTEKGETINGTDKSDIIAGHGGNDTLKGGAGDDIYIYNYGDGKDTINDTGGNDVLIFGDAIDTGALSFKLDKNNLTIEIKGVPAYNYPSGTVIIEKFGSGGAAGAGCIEALEFYYGDRLYLDDIISRLGTDGADSITWTGSAVNLNAGAGKDTITSGDFNDTLTGGAGNDTLKGGGGNDAYIFNRGDGQDTINDTAGNDRILFGEGITKDDLLFRDVP